MANGYPGYSWSDMRGGGTYRLPGPEHLGWWAGVAMILSILFHLAVFIALDRMEIALRFEQSGDVSTRPVNIQRTEVRPPPEEEEVSQENLIEPDRDAASLLEEIDILDALPKNQEIDIKPELETAEYDLKVHAPAQEGDPGAVAMEISAGLEIDSDLPEFGREPTQLKPAEIGQVTVDPGAVQVDDTDLTKFTDDLVKRGTRGGVEKGALDGIGTLDDLLDLPPNLLLGRKTMLPSDLLFEFNKADLRESAKVGLMKLALLIDRNPDLFCWIEGHTDLVGGDDFNLNLSIRRAEAVKNYLVDSLRLDPEKIITRGFGRYQPIVTTGSAEEQAPNRRVEIKMRKTPPTGEQLRVTPAKAPVVEGAKPPSQRPVPPPVVQETPPPPKAVLVKPKRALPVEEEVPPSEPPRAEPVPNPATPPVETPPRAIQRAIPVEE